MKNYDLSSLTHFENGIETVSGVSLQSSNLAFWLAALETETPTLGNHYLQVLSAQRGFENGKHSAEIQRMRKQANEALTLYILWASATGRGQGRGGESQFADILAVYDKAKSNGKEFRRIKLFSIRDLLKKLCENSDYLSNSYNYVIMKPSLVDGNIIIDNDYVGDYETPDYNVANKRITQMLAHARSINISAALTKLFLIYAAN